MGLLYEDITENIIGRAICIHNDLGNGYLEKVYENSLKYELKDLGYKVKQQQGLKVIYNNRTVGEYVADLVVEDKIILEIKAAKCIEKSHVAQVINYLNTTGYKLGYIINFGEKSLRFKRVIAEEIFKKEVKEGN